MCEYTNTITIYVLYIYYCGGSASGIYLPLFVILNEWMDMHKCVIKIVQNTKIRVYRKQLFIFELIITVIAMKIC